MKKILILGSNGSLGSQLVKTLSTKKFQIFAQTRKKNSKYFCEFKKSKDFNKLIKKINPGVVINTISNTNVELCELNFKKCFEDNVLTAKIISEVCGKYKVKLIYISSDQVYSGKGPHSELKFKPLNNYGISKLLAEKYALNNHGVVLRVNFVGKNKKKKTFHDQVIFSKKKKFILYKNIFFSPLHISTLTELISNNIFKLGPGVYNLGSKNKISKSNFIKLLCKLVNIKKKFIIQNYSNKNVLRPLDMSMNISKINKVSKVNFDVNNEIYKLANEYKKN